MSKRSLLKFPNIPPDQKNPFVLFLAMIYAPLLPSIWIILPPPISYVVASIVFIVVLAILPMFYIKAIVREELLFNFIDQNSLLDNLNFSPTRNVDIFYKGTRVSKKQLHSLVLKIHNDGNTQIKKEDFNGKRILIKFPEEINVLDVAAKEKSGDATPGNPVSIDARSIAIPSFVLDIHEWFHIRFIFAYYEGQGLIEKIKEIEIVPEKKDQSGFAFKTIIKYEDWEDRRERRARFPHTLLVSLLVFFSVISLAFGTYVWFFSDSNFLPLPYQFLLALLITVPYFGLIFSIFINRIAPPVAT